MAKPYAAAVCRTGGADREGLGAAGHGGVVWPVRVLLGRADVHTVSMLSSRLPHKRCAHASLLCDHACNRSCAGTPPTCSARHARKARRAAWFRNSEGTFLRRSKVLRAQAKRKQRPTRQRPTRPLRPRRASSPSPGQRRRCGTSANPLTSLTRLASEALTSVWSCKNSPTSATRSSARRPA